MSLPDYQGQTVARATVSIRNTGHGLEEALAADPVALPIGSRHFVVLECEVEKHRHDTIADSDSLVLVNMLKANGRATFVDEEVVIDALEAQQKRIDEHKGTPQLDYEPDAE